VCSRCWQTGRQLEIHDRRVKRWRHLDLGANRCVIECELRRLRCRDCGVHLEAVPWVAAGLPAHPRSGGRRGVAGFLAFCFVIAGAALMPAPMRATPDAA
jgi:hypothetical protein